MVVIGAEPSLGQRLKRAWWLIALIGVLASCTLAWFVVGCESYDEQATTDQDKNASNQETENLLPEKKGDRGKRAECISKLESISLTTRDEELAAYYRSLPEIVLSTRIVPVAYLQTPKRTSDPEAESALRAIEAARSPRSSIRTLIKRNRSNKPFLRSVLLRQSYLFASSARVAEAMVRELHLEDLFDEPRIYLHRGGITHILELKEDQYIRNDKEPAKLLLGDRVSNDRLNLLDPLHIDLLAIKTQTGATRTALIATGEDSAWVELVFPDGKKIPAKVSIVERKSVLTCIADDVETPGSLKAKYSRFWLQHEKTIDAAKRMVAERHLFDEPKDEEEGVQEDGDLRLEWNKAYHRGEKTFFLREEEYNVFDFRGNATPPQVCVDFIFDVFERASGNWYKKRGSRPGRTEGGINFRSVQGMNRRNLPSVLQFAADDSIPIGRYDIPRSDWIPLRKRRLFAEALGKHSNGMREGDMLVIHGLREQDMAEHYHTVLILELDPLTGIPMVVADNQGRPRIGSVFQAMIAAPLRSIKHIIRVDLPEMEIYSRTAALRESESVD